MYKGNPDNVERRQILQDVVIGGETIKAGTIIDLPPHEIHSFGLKTMKAAGGAKLTDLEKDL